MEEIISKLLTEEFSPLSLIVRNDSNLHQGHASSPETGFSHFSITIVSKKFEGLSRIKRHQLVYACLHDLMNNPIHAIAIKTYSPDEI